MKPLNGPSSHPFYRCACLKLESAHIPSIGRPGTHRNLFACQLCVFWQIVPLKLNAWRATSSLTNSRNPYFPWSFPTGFPQHCYFCFQYLTQMCVAFDSPVLSLQGEDNALLVELFMDAKVDQETLKWPNLPPLFTGVLSVGYLYSRQVHSADGLRRKASGQTLAAGLAVASCQTAGSQSLGIAAVCPDVYSSLCWCYWEEDVSATRCLIGWYPSFVF